ncbi:unnamed protein product, partial [Adineta steineri]
MNSSSLYTLLSIRHKGHIEKFSPANTYDYRNATECFDPIFQRFPRFMKNNKASILIHLCLSKMQFGYTPSLQIIAKYKLDAFHDLLVSIKEGQWLLLNKENKISVEIFTRAFQWSNNGEPCDQLQCVTLLATLISQNRIKAYISYKYMTVVLSKEDPFPKVQQ